MPAKERFPNILLLSPQAASRKHTRFFRNPTLADIALLILMFSLSMTFVSGVTVSGTAENSDVMRSMSSSLKPVA